MTPQSSNGSCTVANNVITAGGTSSISMYNGSVDSYTVAGATVNSCTYTADDSGNYTYSIVLDSATAATAALTVTYGITQTDANFNPFNPMFTTTSDSYTKLGNSNVTLSGGAATLTVYVTEVVDTNTRGTFTFNFTTASSGSTNKAPALASGVTSPVAASVAMGSAYSLDLSKIFTDANGDAMTYTVMVDSAAAVAADASYSYTPTASGSHTLVFTPNDGKADGATYTVNLTAYDLAWDGATEAAPVSGTGTTTDPYLISNAAQLAWFRTQVNGGSYSICAKLTADIDLNSHAWTPIAYAADWAQGYTGTFDGDGHVIKGLNVSITENKQAGFFGMLYGSATLENFTLEGSVTSSGTGHVGGIAGAAYTSDDTASTDVITIKNVVNKATVATTNFGTSFQVGGIIGFVRGKTQNKVTLENCVQAGSVSGRYGLVGALTGGTITIKDCASYGASATPITSGTATVSNTFYLANATSGSYGTNKDASQFSSGEVAYAIGMGQALSGDSADAYPVILKSDNSNKVYKADFYSAKNDTTPIASAYFNGGESLSTVVTRLGNATVSAASAWVDSSNSAVTTLGTADASLYVKSNTAPALKDGVSATAAKTVSANDKITFDLTSIFTDADGDALTYTVSTDGAAAESATASYDYYTPSSDSTHTLTFKANDGTADSPTYTVTLTVTTDTPPELIGASSATASVNAGSAYALNLSTVFTDWENPTTLTYKVAIDGAEAVAAASAYSYTPANAGTTTLVFTANDGTFDSATYTVTLTAYGAAWDGTTKAAPTSGTGTAADPYIITNAVQLAWFQDQVDNQNNAGICAKLGADIDLNSQAWTAIGTTHAYTGTFDGAGYTIKGLSCTVASGRAGLFADIDGATLENFVLEGAVSNTGASFSDYAGGVVARTNGACAIKNVINKATVTGTYYGSGIVGYGYTANLTITGCANYGTVKVAGILGQSNNCTGVVIKDCIAAGASTNALVQTGNMYTGITVSNSYYLSTLAQDTSTGTWTGVASKTSDQLASGEVAYLVGMGQATGTDTVPTLLKSDNSNKLYKLDFYNAASDASAIATAYYNGTPTVASVVTALGNATVSAVATWYDKDGNTVADLTAADTVLYATSTIPYLASGVTNPVTGTADLDSSYSFTGLRAGKIFTDPSGAKLSYYYEVSADGGTTWSAMKPLTLDAFGGAEYMLSMTVAGAFQYRVYANNGTSYSTQYWQHNITVVDPTKTDYNVTFYIGQDQIGGAGYNPIIKLYPTTGSDSKTGYDTFDEASAITLTDNGVDSKGYREMTATVKGGTYSYRAYGYDSTSTAEDKYTNFLGGMSISIPAAAVAGTTTDIYLRVCPVYTSTKKNATDYFTAADYTTKVACPLYNTTAVPGTVYTSGNYACYPYVLYSAGNATLYNYFVYPEASANSDGYIWSFGSSVNRALRAGNTTFDVNVNVAKQVNSKITAPTAAAVKVYWQRNNFSDDEIASTGKTDNGDGTTTWSFAIPQNNYGLTYRVTEDGYMTESGFLSAGSDAAATITVTPNKTDIHTHDFSQLGSLVASRDAADIATNVSTTGSRNLAVGETFRLRNYRYWEIIDSDTGNIMVEPDFNVNVLSGAEHVTIADANSYSKNHWVDITGVSAGTTVLAVSYNAINVTNSSASAGGLFPATCPERTAIVILNVGGDGTVSSTLVNSADNAWDSNYDTFYFSGDSGTVSFDTSASIASIDYAFVTTSDDLASSMTDFTAVAAADGAYKIPVTSGGSLLLKVTDTSGNVTYQSVRVAKVSYTVSNATNPGEALMAGDKASITFDGLFRSVNKTSGIFNPFTLYANFTDSAGTSYKGTIGQYQQMDKAVVSYTVDSAQTTATTITLTGKTITTASMFAAANPWHTIYTMGDSGRGTNFNAVQVTGSHSTLPNITIQVADKVYYDVSFAAVDADGKAVDNCTHTVKDSSGNVITDMTKLGYGTYTYEIGKAGYAQVHSSFSLGSATENTAGKVSIPVTLAATSSTAWDGTSATEPSAIDGVYQISNAAELAWFAQQVNAGTNTIKGTIVADIDLGNYDWTPIGGSTASTLFKGTLDGGGHTVSGLYINNTSNFQGLIGDAYGATVKDLTVSGHVDSTGNNISGVIACASKGSTISGITNEVVVNANVKASAQNVGGVVGYLDSSSTIDSCNNTAAVSGGNYVAGIVGNIGSTTSVTNCMNSGAVKGSSRDIAGIVGNAYQAKAISGCFNTGTISGGSYAAGIVGEISYYSSALTVSNCYNTGAISGSNVIGGICGVVNSQSASTPVISNCYNAGVVTGTNAKSTGAVFGQIYNNFPLPTNDYYLEGTAARGIGADSTTPHAVTSVTSNELKTLARTLGSAYRDDVTSSNSGYPVLSWQNFGPFVTTTALDAATVGTAYSYQLAAESNPATTYSWWLDSTSTLPAGLTLSDSGVISGTPTTAGEYMFSVMATNDAGASQATSVTLEVQGAPTITTESLANGSTGTAYAAVLEATGTPSAITWTWAAADGSELPAGLSLDSATGKISGTPTATGTYSVVVTATNGVGTPATKTFSITVKDKYKKLTGTVYVNVSNDSEYLTSDGTIAGTKMWRVPVDLAAVSAIDLDDITLANGTNLGKFKYDADGDGVYEVTYMQLLVYLQENYYSGGIESLGFSGNPGSVWMSGFMGLSGNLTYSTDDTWPLDEKLKEQQGVSYDIGATSDHIVLAPDSTYCIVSSSSNEYWSSDDAGNLYFVTSGSDMTKAGNTTYAYTVEAGKPLTVALKHAHLDMMAYGQTYIPEADFSDFYYASTYDPDNAKAIKATTGSDGTAQITFDTPGTYCLWAEGTDLYSPAAVTVTVTSAEPAITTTELSAGITGQAYSAKVDATGAPTPTLTATGLPAGLAMATDGIISGTPTAAGTSKVTVTAKNSAGSVSTTFSLVVNAAPAITTASLEDANMGVAYTAAIAVTGTDPTVTVAGLPDGLSYDATSGTITGTPTACGQFTVTITATNVTKVDASKALTLNVYSAPVVGSTTLPVASINTPYTAKVDMTGYPTPALYLSADSVVPAGLSFASDGTISGTPTAAGTYTLKIIARNSQGASAATTYTLTVAAAAPAVATTSLADATRGAAYSADLVVTGTPAPAVTVTGLPDGLAYDASTGKIAGTPTVSGSFTVAVSATNGVGSDANASLTLVVNGTPIITTDSTLPSASVNKAYAQKLSFDSYPAASAVLIGGGSILPAGLKIEKSSTGEFSIAGKPTKAGTYTFTLMAMNSIGIGTAKEFTMTVGVAPAITTTTLANAYNGQAYSASLEATGTPSTMTWSWAAATGSTLPEGLSLDAQSGKISGTATTPGTYQVVVTASNGIGSAATKTLTLKVIDKYKQLSGTAYVSVSKDGKFVTSDGAATGTVMGNLVVDLAQVSKIDLDSYGYGAYNYDADGDGTYETTMLQLYIYILEHYYSGAAASGLALSPSSTPGGLWITGFWGVSNPYLTYSVNGLSPLDSSNYMLTADRTALAADNLYGINVYTASDFWGDANACDHFFLDAKGGVTNAYSTYTAQETTVKLGSIVTGMDPTNYTTFFKVSPTTNYTVSYGKAYGTAEGTATTDADGAVKITFPSAGTWYVWADGGNGATHTTEVVSSPALATVTVADKIAPAITTDSLSKAVNGEAYKATLAATGDPASFAWSWAAADGSSLPAGLSLDAQTGVISGTPTASGTYSIVVTADNGAATKTSKTLSLKVIDKYKQLTGTAYISISNDAKYVVSDGEISGVPMTYVPIDLAALSKIDLDNVECSGTNLGKYKLAATDPDADYEYEVTLMQLFVYVLDHYDAGTSASMAISGDPHSSFITKFWGGHDCNFLYYFNGQYALDPSLGTNMGATSDVDILFDGAYCDVSMFTDWAFYTDSNAGFHYFLDDAGTSIVHNYTATAGTPLTVTLAKAFGNIDQGTVATYTHQADYDLYYGTAYDTSTDNNASTTLGTVKTDANGQAQITLDKPGIYYVWCDGHAGDSGTIVSAPGYAIITVPGAPTVTTSSADDAIVGSAYSFKLAATGAPTSYAWYLDSSSALPDGLALAADGTISGTPTKAGTYTFKVMATNSEGASALKDVTLQVNEAPTITTEALANAYNGKAYSASLAASGTPSTMTWSWIAADGSSIPDGLSLDPKTGIISGTPTTNGTYNIVVTATNGIGKASTKALSLKVVDKYKKLTGTVYMSVSLGDNSQSHFMLSDGEKSGVYMWRVPIDLAEVSKIDLDDVTLGGTNLSDAKYDADGDGTYEITMMQLFVYVSRMYSASGEQGFSVSLWGGQAWIGSFMGYDGYCSLYAENDNYPIDAVLTKINGYTMGAALNHIPLTAGNDYEYLGTYSDNFINNMNSDFLVFAPDAAHTTTAGTTYSYDAVAGKPLTVSLKLFTLLGRAATDDNNAYDTHYYPEIGASLCYGTAYNPNGGTAAGKTDSNGQAQITFDHAGTYYVWAKGDGNYTSAMAKVTVSEAPDYTALNAAIAAAQGAESGIAVSKDGTDVAKDAKWVDQATKDALDAAIAAAQKVAADTNATQEQIDAAAKALTDAQAAFVAAEKAGTKSTSATWTRLAGEGRYDTMESIVKTGFAKAGTVILATGENYPDALAASALAGLEDAPIVLTEPAGLSSQAAATIKALGAKNVVIVGGTSAVSAAVASQAEALGASVTRLAGASRTDTALKIYEAGKGSWSDTCIVATAFGFADALSVSPYAYAKKAPVFLAEEDGSLSADTLSAISAGGFKRIVVVGGTKAVSAESAAALSKVGAVTRLGGADRYATSSLVAGFAARDGVLGYASVAVATGENYPDALAGGAVMGKKGGVLLLVASDDTSCIDGNIADNASAIEQGYVLGGTSAVSEDLMKDCEAKTK